MKRVSIQPKLIYIHSNIYILRAVFYFICYLFFKKIIWPTVVSKIVELFKTNNYIMYNKTENYHHVN